jgi:periplasmic protein TonB
MTALALHHRPDGWEIRRYGVAAIAIVLLHVALIAAAFFFHQPSAPVGVSIPAILVDLPPAPAAPQIQTEEDGVAPVSQDDEAPPPEPPKTETIEQLPPTPVQEKPIVAAPPKVEPKPEPAPAKPQPVKDVKKPIRKQLVEATRAAKADRVAATETPAISTGASAAAAAAASYRSMLVAHLQRFKQYPSAANGARGRPVVSITITRSGRVTGSRLAQSSGNAAIDQAVLALVQRAQPMPAFPPEMREASETFAAPFLYKPQD